MKAISVWPVSFESPALPLPLKAEAKAQSRIAALDFARGIAIFLMILSHGVKGLLSLEQFPPWGLVPIHALTKFSSSLFILVFGMSLSVAFVPSIGTDRWRSKRKHLLARGLIVLFWYKVLTIVEMFHLHDREQILQTLQYKNFPSYVEILGFYGLALLWVPWTLCYWKKVPLSLKFVIPFFLAGASWYLYYSFHFWGSDILQALLVEHNDYYTWGQLSRAPLVFAGLALGEVLKKTNVSFQKRSLFALSLLLLSLVLFGFFYWVSKYDLSAVLLSIAMNEGKHPPELDFMLFSMGGAVLILSLSVFGGNLLSKIFFPFTWIGRDSLNSFIFHIFVIFVFYRYLFDYWQKVSYPFALQLTFLLFVLTAVWVRVKQWAYTKS